MTLICHGPRFAPFVAVRRWRLSQYETHQAIRHRLRNTCFVTQIADAQFRLCALGCRAWWCGRWSVSPTTTTARQHLMPLPSR